MGVVIVCKSGVGLNSSAKEIREKVFREINYWGSYRGMFYLEGNTVKYFRRGKCLIAQVNPGLDW